MESNQKLQDTVVKVKIRGDGAKMTRLTNFIIISFSILNVADTVMPSKGVISLINSVYRYYKYIAIVK